MDNYSLLFVDDEPAILSTMERTFRKSPYKVLTAGNGIKALEILEKEPVDILITDQRMPAMSGVELCRIVKQIYPTIIRVIISAYADVSELLAAINQGEVYRFLQKPGDILNIREIADRMVEQVKVIRTFKIVADKLDRQGATYKYDIDYTGKRIEIGLVEEENIMTEERASRILQCLMDWPEVKENLNILSTVLARQNGILTVNLEFGAGMHVAVSLPIKDESKDKVEKDNE